MDELLHTVSRLEQAIHDLWDEIADVRGELRSHGEQLASIFAVVTVSRYAIPVLISVAGIIVAVISR